MTLQPPVKDGFYIRPVRPNRVWMRYFVKYYPNLIGLLITMIVTGSVLSADIKPLVQFLLILVFVTVYWIYFIGRGHIIKYGKDSEPITKVLFQIVRILGMATFITGYILYIYSQTNYLASVQTDTIWLLYIPIVTILSHRESRKFVIGTIAYVFLCLLLVHFISSEQTTLPVNFIIWNFVVKVLWVTFISGTSYILLRYMSDVVANLNLIMNVQEKMRHMEGTLLRSKVPLDEDNYLERAVDIIKKDLYFDHVNIFRVNKYKRKMYCVAGACEGGKELASNEFSLKLDDKKSIIVHVAATEEPYISNNVEKDPHYLHHDAFPKTKSELVIPIFVRNRLYGVLDIQVHQKDYFLEQDLVAIEILINHIGWVIDNAEQVDHISWINRVVETIAEPIFTQKGLEETLQEIADSAQKEMNVDLVYLYSYNQVASEKLSTPIYSGFLKHPEIMETYPTDPDSIVYRLIDHHETILVNEDIKLGEFENNPLFKPSLAHRQSGRPPFITREGIRSNVIIRLMSNGGCVGVLFLNFRDTHTFSDWDKKRYRLFALLAALAIQKMQFQQNDIQNELNEYSGWIHDILIGDTLGIFKILRSINLDADKIGCVKIRGKIDQALDSVKDLNADIRNISTFLKDNPYEDLELELGKLKIIFEQFFNVKTELNLSGDFKLLTPELSREMFLVVREALNNALRHGKAKKISISSNIKKDSISADIIDDGIGFDTTQVKRFNGLLSMRSRINELEGKYRLTSNPGKGTRISFKVPLQVNKEGAE